MYYERVKQLHSDFGSCVEALKAAQYDAEAIEAAVKERLGRERTQQEELRARLVEQREDVSRPATVRRLAERELERLNDLEITVNAEEVAAFEEQISAARQALSDLQRIKTEMRDALEELEGRIRQMRSETLGSSVPELAPRGIDSLEAAFERLVEGTAHE